MLKFFKKKLSYDNQNKQDKQDKQDNQDNQDNQVKQDKQIKQKDIDFEHNLNVYFQNNSLGC